MRTQVWTSRVAHNMRTQVQYLASLLSGLGIQRCPELWCGLQMQLRSGIAVAVAEASSYNSNLTPSLGTSTCRKYSPKTQKTTKPYHSKIIKGENKWHVIMYVLEISLKGALA